MTDILNDVPTPDAHWRESVQGIINMGRFIKKLKATLSRKDIINLVNVDYGVNDSTLDRLVRIADDEIISDPKNIDRLPPSWGLLHEFRLLPREEMVRLIESGEAMGLSKYQIWQIRGIKHRRRVHTPSPKRTGRMGGPRVVIANGLSLIGHIRNGIALEAAENLKAEDVAERLDIYAQTYRMIRTLIQLSERPELTDHDREFINGLLERIEKTRNVRSYYREARPLIEKIWGDNNNAIKNDKGMQKRIDAFRTAIIILHDSCQRVHELEIPYMADEDIGKSIQELADSGRIIRGLAEKLRRSKDG